MAAEHGRHDLALAVERDGIDGHAARFLEHAREEHRIGHHPDRARRQPPRLLHVVERPQGRGRANGHDVGRHRDRGDRREVRVRHLRRPEQGRGEEADADASRACTDWRPASRRTSSRLRRCCPAGSRRAGSTGRSFSSRITLAIVRLSTSLPPPAPNGTMIVTSRAGGRRNRRRAPPWRGRPLRRPAAGGDARARSTERLCRADSAAVSRACHAPPRHCFAQQIPVTVASLEQVLARIGNLRLA